MSFPPQLICVKRKRIEEAPVTFLHFDQDHKRLQRDRWAYQRRSTRPRVATTVPRNENPVIHTSKSGDAPSPKKQKKQGNEENGPNHGLAITGPELEHTSSVSKSKKRRFHVSSSSWNARQRLVPYDNGRKRVQFSPTVFVERRKKIHALKPGVTAESSATTDTTPPIHLDPSHDTHVGVNAEHPLEQDQGTQRHMKRPTATRRNPDVAQKEEQNSAAPAALPSSLQRRHEEDLGQITADMNDWVLREIGCNLRAMEAEKIRMESLKYKPKAPNQRHHERHAELVPMPEIDMFENDSMSDASAENLDGDEWIIEEYVRIPAESITPNVSQSSVGVLVLDEEEENALFFGPEEEEDDDFCNEDDEDENAENYYTADYPEEEAISEDEYAALRHGSSHVFASEEEHCDRIHFSDEENANEFLAKMDGGDDDDDEEAKVARMRAYMKRHSAFS